MNERHDLPPSPVEGQPPAERIANNLLNIGKRLGTARAISDYACEQFTVWDVLALKEAASQLLDLQRQLSEAKAEREVLGLALNDTASTLTAVWNVARCEQDRFTPGWFQGEYDAWQKRLANTATSPSQSSAQAGGKAPAPEASVTDPKVRTYYQAEAERCQRALGEASSPAAQESWQPIETAPEATYVLVVVPNNGMNIASMTRDPNIIGRNGAFWFIRGDRDSCRPTHWMPLPEPPALVASSPAAPEVTDWQRVRYGDTPETRAALAYWRERGWAVDDPGNADADIRIGAFKSGYREALAASSPAPPASGTLAVQAGWDAAGIAERDRHGFGVKPQAHADDCPAAETRRHKDCNCKPAQPAPGVSGEAAERIARLEDQLGTMTGAYELAKHRADRAGVSGEALRALHIKFNVAARRLGASGLPACDGPDCPICAALTPSLEER